jgi:capsular polysaccharide transport system permease protein
MPDSLEDLMLERTNQFTDGPPHPVDGSGDQKSWLRRSRDKVLGFGWLFIGTVLIPTSIAIIYFGFLASDVYISESRFVVRSPDKPSTSGLGILLKSAGFSSAGEEIFAAQDYVLSRDALGAVNKDGAFARAYGVPAISTFDRFNSLGSGDTFEDLYKYYQKKVKVDHETTSSITTLTVRAYSPKDAQRFNEQLLEMAEATVNRLNQRGRQDLIRFATAEVNDAKEKARGAALALSAYRNREGVVDPEKQATVQLQMISKLQDELIANKTQLLQLRAFTPDNPQIEVLDAKVKGLSREIDEQLGKVAGDRKSLAVTAAQYQRLVLESQFADKQLAGAMASLQDALNEARRKQAYVERIVQPNLPDDPLEPRRLRGIVATFILGLVAWGILSMLLAGIREHQD